MRSLCKYKAVKLIVLFDVRVDMMQISHLANLANHEGRLAWVVYASLRLMLHQVSLSLPEDKRERTISCLIFQLHDEKPEVLSGVTGFGPMCVCTRNNEDVARPCGKTAFKDLSAAELPALLTDRFQPAARKIPVPFFTNQCFQKLSTDHTKAWHRSLTSR